MGVDLSKYDSVSERLPEDATVTQRLTKFLKKRNNER